MKFAVDRIENGIAVLENIENNEIVNISLNELPKNINEKDILLYDGKKYVMDDFYKKERISRIKDKMSKLKNSK